MKDKKEKWSEEFNKTKLVKHGGSLYFRRYGQYSEVEAPTEIERVIKNFEAIGFNEACDIFINLLKEV